VVAQEFELTLSRRVITAGPVIVELANFGEDVHDLKLHRLAAGAPTHTIPTVAPGEQGYLRTTLKPGRFLLWCSIADHRMLGMEATLTVKARKKTRR
jgi:uncharacterized cupredoxin-like copper-binding protein